MLEEPLEVLGPAAGHLFDGELVLELLAGLEVLEPAHVLVIFVGTEDAVVEQVVQQVGQRLQIVLSARRLELQLAQTREHQVASEGAHLLLIYVVFLVGLEEGGGEPVVDDAEGAILEDAPGFLLFGTFLII